MFKCNKQCHLCPFIKETKEVKGNGVVWKINKKFNCETENISYLIHCEKCNEQYIGETERSLKERLGEHKTYIKSEKLNEATGEHFNKPGHSIEHLKVTVLEQIKQSDTLYRKERESYFIRKFNTFNRGINKKP